MKTKILTLILVALTTSTMWADVIINSTNFPDAAFRSYVTTKVAGGSDGKLTTAELANVTKIAVAGYGISDLTGIEYFTSLSRLACANNSLTKLNLSANKKLQYLSCYNNQLTDLDFSNNTLLDTLLCQNNRLNTINVSKNINLLYLAVNACGLKSLDVTNNSKLKYLDCNDNNLSELNVDNNLELKNLYCAYNSLETIKVGHLSKMEYLNVHGNLIGELDLTKMTNLTSLLCNRNNLEKLDLSHNKNLSYIHCDNNHITQIKGFESIIYSDWNSENFKADQNVVLPAEMMTVDGEAKYVITMPEGFVADNVKCFSTSQVEMVNSLNGQAGTFFVITPDSKPQSFCYYCYHTNQVPYYSVAVNVNYKSKFCDVNDDGKVDIADINVIIKTMLGQ